MLTKAVPSLILTAGIVIEIFVSFLFNFKQNCIVNTAILMLLFLLPMFCLYSFNLLLIISWISKFHCFEFLEISANSSLFIILSLLVYY